MNKYHVKHYSSGINWIEIEPLLIDTYPWYKSGLKQLTKVKLAVSKGHLFISVDAEDVHSSATVLETNGSVYLDSCFEFFFRPEEAINDGYINLEINCIGTIYMAVRRGQEKRRATLEEVSQIKVSTTLNKGVVKEIDVQDNRWGLQIEIPFSFIESFYGECNDAVWYANFYRCGGAVDDQYAVWNPVITDKPDFHQPLQFGQITFDSEVDVLN